MSSQSQNQGRRPVAPTPRTIKDPPGAAMFCPGCQHPTINRIISEVLEEMDLDGRAICMAGVGCHSFVNVTWDMDMTICAHGRALDSATAIKRLNPEAIVFTIQGDGDCTAIGAGGFINAMTRGENLTTIMYNNTNYGTTGGQMAPTTLIGQRTVTTPRGRKPETEGYPLHAAELAATFRGTMYSARGSVHNAAQYQKTKKYIKTAFKNQLEGIGYSFVEVLCTCPPNWRLDPVASLKRIENEVMAEFPLGEFKKLDQG